MKTLGEALPIEMQRVRDEIMPVYQRVGPSGALALALMRAALDDATRAMAAADVPAMIRAYAALKDFHT